MTIDIASDEVITQVTSGRIVDRLREFFTYNLAQNLSDNLPEYVHKVHALVHSRLSLACGALRGSGERSWYPLFCLTAMLPSGRIRA